MSGDLWPEPSRDASAGWGEWPTEPAQDEYLLEEPPPPVLSDPWAESWSDEASLSPPRRQTWDEPVHEAEAAHSASPLDLEPDAPAQAAPGPDANLEEPPASDDVPADPTPPLRPWSPDVDPWGATVDADMEAVGVQEISPAERMPAEPAPPTGADAPTVSSQPEPAPDEPGRSADAPPEPSIAGAFRGLGRAARTVLPDWLAEPVPPREDDSDAAAAAAAANPLEAPTGTHEQPAPEVEEVAAAPVIGVEPSPSMEATEADADAARAAEALPAADSDALVPPTDAESTEPPATRRWWRSVGPWGSPAEPAEPAATAASDAPDVVEAASPEAAVHAPAPVAAPAPGIDRPTEEVAPAPSQEEPAEPTARSDAEPSVSRWTVRPSDTSAPDEGAPAGAVDADSDISRSSNGPMDGPPAPIEPAWPVEPTEGWSTTTWGPPSAADTESAEHAPRATDAPIARGVEAPAWDDPSQPAVESTQVLPTSWAAPVPEPRPAAPPSGPLTPVAGDIRTRLREARDGDIEVDADGEPEPTTAEQAVPWLIGFILLLAGMVIVLLALIFAGDESLGGGGAEPTASAPIGLVTESAHASPSATAEGSPTPRPSEPAQTAAPSVVSTATPLAIPEYGPLEMIYQGRSAALAPIYLLHREFTLEGQPEVLAQDPALDVRRFAWSPDGTVGVGLYADVLVSVEIGTEKRRLGDGLSTVTFGDDSETVYAVRVTQDGDNDVATVLAIDFASADTREVASVSYPRPNVAVGESLTEAQSADDGGPARLYWMEDDMLRLWIIGGGAWHITPDSGEVTEVDDVAPVLWAPDGESRIGVEDGAQSTLRLLDEDEDVTATTTVGGLVSHLRWSPSGDRVVFTVARSAAAGGILQDLFLWDLADGTAPTQLTATGAAFGAEWRGSQPRWAPG